MSERTHRCGGRLSEATVEIRHEEGGLLIIQEVAGLVCDKCQEKLIEHDTVLAMQHLNLPSIWFSGQPIPQTSEITSSPPLPPKSSAYVVA